MEQYLYSVKRNKCQPRIIYPAKILLRSDGEVKAFSDQQELIAFVAKRPILEEMLKKVLQDEEK